MSDPYRVIHPAQPEILWLTEADDRRCTKELYGLLSTHPCGMDGEVSFTVNGVEVVLCSFHRRMLARHVPAFRKEGDA